jgi:hypothetical protein
VFSRPSGGHDLDSVDADAVPRLPQARPLLYGRLMTAPGLLDTAAVRDAPALTDRVRWTVLLAVADFVLWLLTLGLLMAGPEPRRATRWAWFRVPVGPLAVAAAAPH